MSSSEDEIISLPSVPKRSRMDPSAASTSSEQETDNDSRTEQNSSQSIRRNGNFSRRNYRTWSSSDQESDNDSRNEQNSSQFQRVRRRPEHNSPQDNETENGNETDNEPTADESDTDSSEVSLFSTTPDTMDSLDFASPADKLSRTEIKVNKVLEKEIPKCNLNLVRNLIYRQSAIFYNGRRNENDLNSKNLIHRINNSIYSVERMALSHKLEKHKGCVNCLNFNKAGNHLVTGSDDLQIIVWNWAKNKIITSQPTGHQTNIFQSKFIENGTANNQTDFNLITSARDGDVRQMCVRPDGSATHRSITKHAKAVHKIAIPDSNPNEILTAGEDGCVIRCDLRDKLSESLVTVVGKHHKPKKLYSIAMHPFAPEFCVCGQDKYVRIYDRRNPKYCSKILCPAEMLQKQRYNGSVTCAVYNYWGTEILASYGEENVYLFDSQCTTPGSFLHSYVGHNNSQTIKGVNFFGTRSQFVMSGSDCGNFFIWDKESEAIVQWLDADRAGVVNCLESHQNFPVIATSGLDHNIKIWLPLEKPGRLSKIDLQKCMNTNLSRPRRFFSRWITENMLDSEDSFDLSDDDSDDDEEHNFPIRSANPCEVQ